MKEGRNEGNVLGRIVREDLGRFLQAGDLGARTCWNEEAKHEGPRVRCSREIEWLAQRACGRSVFGTHPIRGSIVAVGLQVLFQHYLSGAHTDV